MNVFYKTYKLNSKDSLHSWCKNAGVFPTNDKLFGKKLIRLDDATLAKHQNTLASWPVSKPENSLGGEPFTLQTTVCFSKSRSSKDVKRKFSALSKEEALVKFCSMTGLEKVYEKDSSYVNVTPVRGIFIHGVEDKNVFHITGTFRVVDEDKFINAYNQGVGRRKSYGCGLIVVL